MQISAIKRWIASPGRCTKVLLCTVAALVLLWLMMHAIVPRKLFDMPYSTLLYSAEGELMGARIAVDGQWRFPQEGKISDKFAECLVTFEDKRFYWHPGIDPLAVARAVRSNAKAGGVVSGGSTLTMQLARLARGNRERTLYQKMVEACWALFFETKYSKRLILTLYASHAPFGGNVVGVESAAWRYFGRSSEDLSWAESAMLAILPNSPALIHPGRNRDALKAKRDRLLAKLAEKGTIDQMEYELACMEPLPEAPLQLPNQAPHLLERLALQTPQSTIHTSVKQSLQIQVQNIVDRYAREYASNHIYNLAAIIADVETGEVVAYAGNVSFESDSRHGNSVDIITSLRSTGSILKPFLYAGMLNDGMILPNTLISDTPLNINGFTPQNFNKTFYGVVPAHRAIERSLNVPLVRMLSMYNTGRFMSLLKSYGMTTLKYSEEHYGAALILGGAEGTLWDLVGMYASMARTLNHFRPYNSRYDMRDIHPLSAKPVVPDDDPITTAFDKRLSNRSTLSAASIWYTFDAMSALNRPEEEVDWQQFSSMKKVAWKTGTSHGGRDAWAIGATSRYVVGVWAGNASGEGRPGITGVSTSAPVLFDIFSLLPNSGWFEIPHDEMELMPICRKSGHKASSICEQVDTLPMPRAGTTTIVCPYHHLVHLSLDESYQVNSSCESADKIVSRGWFVLPPAQEYYFRKYNMDYASLPPFRRGCESGQMRQIDIIYPEHNAVLFLPKGFSQAGEMFVFRAAHAQPTATIYWHIDSEFLGETRGDHQISCSPKPGKHTLILTDSEGNQRKVLFEVTSK